MIYLLSSLCYEPDYMGEPHTVLLLLLLRKKPIPYEKMTLSVSDIHIFDLTVTSYASPMKVQKPAICPVNLPMII